MNGMFGNGLLIAEKSMDYLWKKQSVGALNIANVDTPGYKAKYVTFEDTFRSKLRAASGSSENIRDAVNKSVWQVNRSDTESARMDGNNVIMDAEVTELTRTALQYQYMIQSANSDITRLSTVIKG